MYVTVAVGCIQGKGSSHKRMAVNRGVPQWQRVEYWYQIRIVLKGRWDISWFKHPQGVVLLPK